MAVNSQIGRTAYYFMKHRARAFVCLFFICVIAVELPSMEQAWGFGFFVALLDMVLLCVTIRFVKAGGVLLVVIFFVAAVLPSTSGSPALVACYPALALLSFESDKGLGVGATTVVAFSWLFSAIFYDGLESGSLHAVFGSATANLMLIIGSSVVGRAFRMKDIARASALLEQELQWQKARLNIAENNARLSEVMHSSLTGMMTDIELVVKQELSSDNCGAWERKSFETIQRCSTAALTTLHGIIRMMHDGQVSKGGIGQMEIVPFEEDIRDKITHEDERMHLLGFTGAGAVDGTMGVAAPYHVSLSIELVAELYNNIVRHCDPGNHEYHLLVTLSEDCIVLFETNPAGLDPMIGGPSGTGLLTMEKMAQEIGGSLTTNLEDGSWIIRAVLPK